MSMGHELLSSKLPLVLLGGGGAAYSTFEGNWTNAAYSLVKTADGNQ